jgi:hypothetical protein
MSTVYNAGQIKVKFTGRDLIQALCVCERTMTTTSFSPWIIIPKIFKGRFNNENFPKRTSWQTADWRLYIRQTFLKASLQVENLSLESYFKLCSYVWYSHRVSSLFRYLFRLSISVHHVFHPVFAQLT